MTSHKYKTQEGVAMVKGLIMFFINPFNGKIETIIFNGKCDDKTKYYCVPENAIRELVRLQLNN